MCVSKTAVSSNIDTSEKWCGKQFVPNLVEFLMRERNTLSHNPEVYFANRNQTCQRHSVIDPCKLEPMFRLAALSQNSAECPFFHKKKESE